MRKQYDLKRAVDALTEPRFVHTTQPDPTPDDPRRIKIVTVEHPALIDLLEQGTGTRRGGSAVRSGGNPSPIDDGALETWAQIRDQVRSWLGALRAPVTDDLKADLRTWHGRHELAAARGRVTPDAADTIERIVDTWQTRIEQKYDPDEKREWTEPCPHVIDVLDKWGATTGRTKRCGARRVLLDEHGRPLGPDKTNGRLQFAIQLNVTKREAECRACGHRWEGERQLIQLRYESNLWDLERALEQAADEPPAAERRELALTGPIDLP